MKNRPMKNLCAAILLGFAVSTPLAADTDAPPEPGPGSATAPDLETEPSIPCDEREFSEFEEQPRRGREERDEERAFDEAFDEDRDREHHRDREHGEDEDRGHHRDRDHDDDRGHRENHDHGENEDRDHHREHHDDDDGHGHGHGDPHGDEDFEHGVLEFAEHHFPDLLGELREHRRHAPDAYREQIHHLAELREEFHHLREEEPEMAERMLEIHRLEHRSHRVAHRLAHAEGPEAREELGAHLREILNHLFELKLQEHLQHLENLEREMEEIRRLVERRRHHRERIIERRMHQLVEDGDEALRW